MFQNVIRLEKTSNSESVSLPVWRLETFCWGDMKKNIIKGRSLESVWTVLNYPIIVMFDWLYTLLYRITCDNYGYPFYTPYYRLSRLQMSSGTQTINKLNEIWVSTFIVCLCCFLKVLDIYFVTRIHIFCKKMLYWPSVVYGGCVSAIGNNRLL